VALGRFFFVQRAQAVRDGSRLQTFEFLHATFGEYLAARLTVQLAANLLTRGSALMVGRPVADDDLLYALLSFAPLATRQILRFVKSLCQQQVPSADRPRIASLLISVLADSETRAEHRYHAYQPARVPTSSRHGIYSANLVLLTLALEPTVSASRLFPVSEDPPGTWHRRVLLWRSSMTEPDWTDLGLAVSIRHTWAGDRRDLEISLSGTPPKTPEPIDPYWHYRYPPSDASRDDAQWHRPYWGPIGHKMDISGGTNDSTVRHAVEPLFRWIGASITTFHGSPTGHASSIAHDLTHLWLSRALDADSGNLAGAYERLALVFGPQHLWDAQMQTDAIKLLLHFLRMDAARLPAAAVARYLEAALDLAGRDDAVLALVLEGALSALRARSDDGGPPEAFELIAADVVSKMQNRGRTSALLAWVIVHKDGGPYAHLFGRSTDSFMARIAHSHLQDTHPELVRQALSILAIRYPGTVMGGPGGTNPGSCQESSQAP
jgi:hypothetical protein